MLQGFKEFISRGNAVEMAVGIVIGAAFGNVITQLVDRVVNPLIAALFGKPNFDNVLSFTFNGAEEPIAFGYVLTALINFLLVALALYVFVVVPMNRLAALRHTKDAEPEAPADDVRLLTEIRDLLKSSSQPGR
ncbi:MAG: large conductance mechanosensitive channel protein MscL [Bowdeniella nasicola]|nr:large conductance mechanosensitive channel protein MscL [Bowdeniella nasicola]